MCVQVVLTPAAPGSPHELLGLPVPHEPLEALPPRQLLRLLGELELRDRRLLGGGRVVGRVVGHVAVLLVRGAASHPARSLAAEDQSMRMTMK